jgi:hypothetical protein
MLASWLSLVFCHYHIHLPLSASELLAADPLSLAKIIVIASSSVPMVRSKGTETEPTSHCRFWLIWTLMLQRDCKSWLSPLGKDPDLTLARLLWAYGAACCTQLKNPLTSTWVIYILWFLADMWILSCAEVILIGFFPTMERWVSFLLIHINIPLFHINLCHFYFFLWSGYHIAWLPHITGVK